MLVPLQDILSLGKALSGASPLTGKGPGPIRTRGIALVRMGPIRVLGSLRGSSVKIGMIQRRLAWRLSSRLTLSLGKGPGPHLNHGHSPGEDGTH